MLSNLLDLSWGVLVLLVAHRYVDFVSWVVVQGVLVLRDFVRDLSTDSNGSLVDPAASDVAKGVASSTNHYCRDAKAFHVSDDLSMASDAQVE